MRNSGVLVCEFGWLQPDSGLRPWVTQCGARADTEELGMQPAQQVADLRPKSVQFSVNQLVTLSKASRGLTTEELQKHLP